MTMEAATHPHTHAHGHTHTHGHGHSHGLVDPSIKRSRAGLRAVGSALLILGLTAAAQALVFVGSGSVALLADLIHNAGDAATAFPLGIAFALRSAKAERWAGLAVVLAIFASACVAAYEAVDRLIDPREVAHLGALTVAGAMGFAGNWWAAIIRSRAGKRLASPGVDRRRRPRPRRRLREPRGRRQRHRDRRRVPIVEPLIGLAMSAVILRITWHSWQTVKSAPDRRNPA